MHSSAMVTYIALTNLEHTESGSAFDTTDGHPWTGNETIYEFSKIEAHSKRMLQRKCG